MRTSKTKNAAKMGTRSKDCCLFRNIMKLTTSRQEWIKCMDGFADYIEYLHEAVSSTP